jgi:peptide/nickel transport system substrate-binding protein
MDENNITPTEPDNKNSNVITPQNGYQPMASSVEANTGTTSATPAQMPGSGSLPTVQTGQPKTTGHPMRLLMAALVVVLLAVAGFAAYRATRPKAIVTTPIATKKDVALLRVGTNFPNPTSFYPNSTDDNVQLDENHQLFEGLTGYKDATKVSPLLAKSWTNPDANTWIFALQHNVKFHDGNLMTAKQVAASINQVLPTDYGQRFGATIKNVTVVDAYTVKITTSAPDALLPNKLTFLNIFDTDNTAQLNNPVNGTGPYIVKAGTIPSTTELDLVVNPDYWGGHVYTRALDLKSYESSSDILAALNSHQIDMGGPLTIQDQPQVASDFSKFDIPTSGVSQLVPNTLKGGPLANVKVRQALWLALDSVAIAKAKGVQATVASQIVPVQIPGYDSTLTRPATDAATAKQQIAAAGYPNGFSFTLTYFSTAPLDSAMKEVQQELKAAGVTVILDGETDGHVIEQKALSGKADMYYNSITTDLLDGSDIMYSYVKSPSYDNPQLDALYTQASQTLDPAKHLQILKQMSNLIYTDKSTLPLYSETLTWVQAKNLNLHLSYNGIGGQPGLNYYQMYSQ